MKTSHIGFFASLAIFIFIILFLKYCSESDEKGRDYKGILVEIFRDDDNRAQNTYKIQTSQGYVNLTVRSYPKSLSYIEVGDSIIKNKGELRITVKKRESGFSRMATFYYN